MLAPVASRIAIWSYRRQTYKYLVGLRMHQALDAPWRSAGQDEMPWLDSDSLSYLYLASL